MVLSQSYYLATSRSVKRFMHRGVTPLAGSCLIDHLCFLLPLCCQSMFLMSFWLCHALRSNTSHSNLSWHFVQLIWQSLGSLFFSKLPYVSKSLFRSWCLLCWCFILCFWILKRFCVPVPRLLWEQFPIFHISLSVSISHAFCMAHNFCHSQIQTVLVICPISQDILAQHLIINTFFSFI